MELWTNAAQRQRVTDAANEIDRRLATDPSNEGESRDRGRRMTFVAPLGVIFRVLPEQRVVVVIAVWQFRTK
jgi:hypothetical protein